MAMTLTRTRLCGPTLVALLLSAPLAFADEPAKARPDKLRIYVGTYTEKTKSKGVYVLEIDLATGKLSEPRLAGEAVNPSFVAIAPDHRHLYAVDEIADFKGQKAGAISAFAIEKGGTLKHLNRQSSKGAGPCHVIVDRTGKYILAANYGGGSVVVLPIQEGGKLGGATGFVQHRGKSVNPDRQEGPHCHSINLDNANRFAAVADLGLDTVSTYPLDTVKGTFGAQQAGSVLLPGNSGPRHFAFHPDGKHAYVINELNCTVTAFRYNGRDGGLKVIETVSTLPGTFKAGYSTAEVQVHPSGKFLYGSNRGHNSIAVFAIDGGTGKLTRLENVPTQGKTPRNFAIDPTGTYLVAANQDSDSLVVFRIDPQTGRLRAAGHTAEVPAPVCVKFMPLPR
jgi:6-phosphogluconolactonase